MAGVSITVSQGEFVSIIGPSGCGKSTLLNIIAGLDQSDSGTVALDEDLDESQARRSIGPHWIHAAKGPVATLADGSG